MKQMMFFLTLLLGLNLFGVSAFATQVFNDPTLEIDGVPHKIIDEDILEDDWYDDSATGYCRLQGFDQSFQTSAVKGWYGPYVALDKEGRVLSTFPDEGNADRFYELTQIICK